MKLLAPLLTLLIGLGIGIAVGWVLASDETDSAHKVAATQPVEDACDEPTDEPAPLHTNEPGRSETDSTPGGDWTDQLALNVEAAGDSTIRGRVTTGDGSRVPGVWISAAANVPAPEIAADATPQDRLEARAHHLAREVALERTAQTDADGRYEVTGLDGDTYYELEAKHEGYDIDRVGRWRTRYMLPGDEVDFTAKAAVKLKADVRLPDGRQPAFARIEFCEEDAEAPRRRHWIWSASSTTRFVEPGAWQLTVRAGDDEEYTADPVSLDLEVGDKPDPMTIRLKVVPCILGRVAWSDVSNNSRIQTELLKAEGGEYKPIYKNLGGGRGYTERVVRGNKFQFHDLEPGNYRLEVTYFEKVLMTRDVIVGDDIVRVVLRPPEPDVKDYIPVHVIGPEGPLTENVRFYLAKKRESASSSGSVGILNRGEGEYWILREESWFDEGKGWYEVTVESTEYGERTKRYERTDSHVLRFQFGDPAYVTVHVEGFDEHPERRYLKVHLDRASEASRRRTSGSFRWRNRGKSGSKVRFGPIDPGQYAVSLSLGSERPFDERIIERKETHLVSGENVVNFAIPELYSFVIEIPEKYRDKYQLNVHRMGDPGFNVTQRKKNAEFHVENLNAGEYVIYAGGLGQMKVLLPAMDGRRVRFEPKPFNAYKLIARRKTDGDDLGLKVGDFVVEIDGNSLEEFDRRFEFLKESRASESTTWVVIRNGIRMTVTFDGRKYLDSGYQLMPGRVD